MRLLLSLLLLPLAACATDRPAADPAALKAAIAAARPGDRIVMQTGDWRDVDLTFTGEGTAELPITLAAAEPGRVRLVGASRLRISGRWLVVDGLYFVDGGLPNAAPIEFRGPAGNAEDCRLTNSAIVGYNHSESTGDPKWVSLYGQRNRVDHCYIAGKTSSGTTVVVWVENGVANHHRLDHNHFGPREQLGKNGGETIRIGTSDVSLTQSETIVEDNLFTACNGEVECISNKSCGNVYRRNTFRGVSATLTLRHGNGCLVDGNVFLGEGVKGSGGVRVIGEDHRVVNNAFVGLLGDRTRSAISVMQGIVDSPLSGYLQVKRPTIAYNTFIDCKSAIEFGSKGSGTSLPTIDGALVGNLFVNNAPPLVKEVLAPVGWVMQDNLVAGDDPARDGFRLLPAIDLAPDPGWRLVAGSAAKDATAPSDYAPREDIDGQPRDERPDAGCDELAGEPLARALTTVDCGPGWLTAR